MGAGKYDIEYVIKQLDLQRFPPGIRDGLRGYLLHHLKPGSFLMAVLTNDLRMAIAHGNDESIARLRDIVTFLHCQVPGVLWGDSDRVAFWISGCCPVCRGSGQTTHHAGGGPGQFGFQTIRSGCLTCGGTGRADSEGAR